MELATQNGFGSFGDVFGETPAFKQVIDVEPIVETKPKKTGGNPEHLLFSVLDKMGDKAGRASRNTIGGYISTLVSGIAKGIVDIVSKAIKVAIFKFGIELCAMSIKALVETMVGKNLTPPSIDTQGVYYNFNNVNRPTGSSSTPNNSYNNSRPTFDNPFGNPFMPF